MSGEIRIRPTRGLAALRLNEVWTHRDLLYFLVWRDVRVRYKQAVLGAGWAILQPVFGMGLFSVVFGSWLDAPSGGVPYPLFVLCGLIPWQLFAYSLSQASTSLVSNAQLITKVYFPRVIVPVAVVGVGMVDALVAVPLVVVGVLVYQQPVSPLALLLPLVLVYGAIVALAAGIFLSAANARYRDVRHALPFVTQLWFFATPVAYSSEVVPLHLRWLYAANPMTGVVDGFRAALLPSTGTAFVTVPIGLLVAGCFLMGAVAYFLSVERSLADVL